MELTLITGFLGAGKTTFLQKLLPLFAVGRKRALLVNEFGRVGTDGALLAHMGVELTEIPGGSIFCSCRSELFEDALAALVERGVECAVAEASGLSDPTAFGRMLAENPRLSEVRFQGCICLADARNFHKVVDTAAAVERQVQAAGLILLNKTDLASPQEIQHARVRLRALNPSARIEETSFGALKTEWLSALAPIDAVPPAAIPGPDLSLQKYTLSFKAGVPPAVLQELLSRLLPACDRMKGFIESEGALLLVNAVGGDLTLEAAPVPVPGDLHGRLTVLSAGGKKTHAAVKSLLNDGRGWITAVE